MTGSSPNIIWITIDMLRADHTSLHEYERDTTPNLAEYASRAEATSFDNCFAVHPKTYASVSSMMTGLYPSRHQVGMGNMGKRLPDSIKTVPELLHEVGYHTLGISGGWAGPGIGLDERFNRFVNPNLSTLLSYPHIKTLCKYFIKQRMHGPGFSFRKSKHSDQTSYYTTDVAKRELNSLTTEKQPFFAYIHYMDPHNPFYPPKEFEDKYVDSPKQGYEIAKEMHEDPYSLMANGLPWSDKELDILSDMYDSVIQYTDQCVGNLLETIDKSFENTIVIITSDHGVLLGEYNLLGHRIALHDAATHVPLIVSGLPDISDSGSPVQHIDIMQTILSMVGADISQFQGVNLMDETREFAISQYYKSPELSQDFTKIVENNPEAGRLFDPSTLLTTMRGKTHKYLHTSDWDRLFKVPNEHRDVRDEFPEEYEKMSNRMREWIKSEGQPLKDSPDDAELSKDVETQLRELGYLN